MNEELKIIKKKYGEKMAHFCRDNFPTILETDGLLLKLLLDNFEPSHDLYEDIIEQNKETEFKNYIYSLVDVEKDNKEIPFKTPEYLLSEAGYDLYECTSEKDIQKFKKYYAKGEELCTFHGGRLNRCYVFFAVKKNVSEIKRKNFSNPQRQDEYGTSVISIQFTRDKSHTLSIKNRYNHHVSNPDCTFSNNLDNIIEGLTESFSKYYNLSQDNISKNFELKGYVQANDGKFYKYNQENFNIYYCPNNIIIDDFEVKRYDKEKYIVFEYFILDLVNKKIRVYDNEMEDSFPSTLTNIHKIEVKRKEENKEIKITLQDNSEVIIILNKDNQIIKFENQNLKEAQDYFLSFVPSLEEFNVPNLEKVGKCFLMDNNIKKIYLPKLQRVGWGFLHDNFSLEELDLPSLEEVSDDFLYFNQTIHKLNLPKLQKVGNCFLYYNTALEELLLPELLEAQDDFLYTNNALKEIRLPKLQRVGRYFLYRGTSLKKLSLPSLREVWGNFLDGDTSLEELDLPLLEEVGPKFLFNNNRLKKLDLPLLKKARDSFLAYNKIIQEVNLPSLVTIGNYFLDNALCLKEIYLPSLEEVGDCFLFHNNSIEKLYLPKLIKAGEYFMPRNKVLKEVYLPSIEIIGNHFLAKYPELTRENFGHTIRR